MENMPRVAVQRGYTLNGMEFSQADAAAHILGVVLERGLKLHKIVGSELCRENESYVAL